MHTRLPLNLPEILLLTSGVTIMGAAVLTGNAIQPEVSQLGMDGYIAAHGWPRFMLFAFGFPIGLVISAMGLFAVSGGRGCGVLPFGFLLLIAAFMPILAPAVLGRQADAAFFGISGYILMFLILASFWFWAVHRASLQDRARNAADLQGTGYACFALVAWNLCGMGGMPGFALDPQTMLATGSNGFVIGQLKAIMLLLLSGWSLTLLGYYLSAHHRCSNDPEGE